MGSFLHHHVHDVRDPDPGYQKGEQTDHPQEDLNSCSDLLRLLLALDEVPHRKRTLVGRVEPILRAQDLEDLGLRLFRAFLAARVEQDVVHVAVSVDRLERRSGNDRALLVRPVVHAVLELPPHHPDDREWQTVQIQRLSDRIFIPEQPVGDRVAEKQHSTALLHVPLVDESAAGLRIHLPQLREHRVHAFHVRRRLHIPIGEGHAPAPVGRTGHIDVVDRAHHEVHVFLGQADSPTSRQAFEFLARLATVGHEDLLARIQKTRVDLLFQSFSKRQQQHDGDRAPGDREHGKKRTGFLGPEVPEELLQQNSPHRPRLPTASSTRPGRDSLPCGRGTTRRTGRSDPAATS